MTAALLLLVGGFAVIGVILAGRMLEASAWHKSLVAFRLSLPANLTLDDVAYWLSSVNAAIHAPRFSLLPAPPIVIEVRSTSRGIEHVIAVPKNLQGALLSGLHAGLPGTRVEELSDYLSTRPKFRVAAEATVTSHTRPLGVDRAEAASHALLANLQPVSGSAVVTVQWIITSGGIQRPVASVSSGRRQRESWWPDSGGVLDAEAVQAHRRKLQQPIMRACVRVGVAASTRSQAYSLFGKAWGALRILNAPGAGIVRRWWLPSAVVRERLRSFAVPLTAWPLTLNTEELGGLLGFPLGSAHLPGLPLGTSRQLPPPIALPTRGAIFGVSNYPGAHDRPLAVSAEDRTRHTYVLGPAGSGKSVLLTRLIADDLCNGRNVIALDMKADLVPGILGQLEEADMERVLVLDASKRDFCIGFNPLGQARSEEDRELIVDGVITIFRELWASFWGPRSESVLRAALGTLVATKAPDGSAFTMCEILPLLTDTAFRHTVTSQPTLPPMLKDFWVRFDRLSVGERTQAIGPVLNKVEAFTARTATRLLLGQSEGALDFREVFRGKRSVLVSLSQGNIGTETSTLLGALLVFSLWRAALERVDVPLEQRFPVFGYIDEAQTLVKLPVPLAEMLAQARGFKFGLTLANQYLAQLPEAVRSAVLGTIRTQLTFAPQYDDARLLERHFTPLTADELRGLPAYEFALRPSIGGGSGPVVTGRSLPLPEPVSDADALALQSRMRFGAPRAEVEAALAARVKPATHKPLGRTPKQGAAS